MSSTFRTPEYDPKTFYDTTGSSTGGTISATESKPKKSLFGAVVLGAIGTTALFTSGLFIYKKVKTFIENEVTEFIPDDEDDEDFGECDDFQDDEDEPDKRNKSPKIVSFKYHKTILNEKKEVSNSKDEKSEEKGTDSPEISPESIEKLNDKFRSGESRKNKGRTFDQRLQEKEVKKLLKQKIMATPSLANVINSSSNPDEAYCELEADMLNKLNDMIKNFDDSVEVDEAFAEAVEYLTRKNA